MSLPLSLLVFQFEHVFIIHARMIEVRDSRTGYLLPARDGPGALPDGQSCWDAAVAVAAVSRKMPKYEEINAQI